MIRRGPRPDTGFLIIRNEVLRDSRLSYRARGLLAAMLSFPDNWRFDREWLAKESRREGVAAIRTALKELEKAGYLKRERVKLKDGRFIWEHELFDLPQPVDTEDAEETAGRTTGHSAAGGSATNDSPAAAKPPSLEEPSRSTQTKTTSSSAKPCAERPATSRTSAQDKKKIGPSKHEILAKHGCVGAEADHVVATLVGKNANWYRTVDEAGDMPDVIAKVLESMPRPKPEEQPHCGRCDRRRWTYIYTARIKGNLHRPCPNCHSRPTPLQPGDRILGPEAPAPTQAWTDEEWADRRARTRAEMEATRAAGKQTTAA